MISVEDSGWTIIPPQPFQDPHYDICQDLSRGSLHSNRSRHVLLWQELLTLKCAAKCPPKARVTIQTTLKINRQRKQTRKKQSKLNSKKILIMCAGSNAHRKYKKADMLRNNACMNAAILLQQKDATINNRIKCNSAQQLSYVKSLPTFLDVFVYLALISKCLSKGDHPPRLCEGQERPSRYSSGNNHSPFANECV